MVAEGGVCCARRDGGFLNAVFCDVFVMESAKIRHLTSYLVEVKLKCAHLSSNCLTCPARMRCWTYGCIESWAAFRLKTPVPGAFAIRRLSGANLPFGTELFTKMRPRAQWQSGRKSKGKRVLRGSNLIYRAHRFL